MSAMLFMCMTITAFELTNKPLDCTASGILTSDIVNTHCMAENLYTIRQKMTPSGRQSIEIYPGISGHYRGQEKDVKYHSFYRYTPLYMLVEALLFTLTNCLWKYLEDGVLQTIIQDLNINCNRETFDQKRNELIKHSATAINTMQNTTEYAAKYYFCMFLSLVNVGIQFAFTHWFLNEGDFLYYGYDVVKYYIESYNLVEPEGSIGVYKIYSPMHIVFPRQGKCTLFTFGPSGTVQHHNVLCYMPMNSMNDKMFVALWFWFIILAVTTIFCIAYGLCFYGYHMFRMRTKPVPVGYRFVLDLVQQNVDQITFGKIVDELERQIAMKKDDPEMGNVVETDDNEGKQSEEMDSLLNKRLPFMRK